jgi:hypothetical protein
MGTSGLFEKYFSHRLTEFGLFGPPFLIYTLFK